tara:strand:- start:9 stop:227 length:219 start_codon:yes stop_codon:yes gene_type:complete
MKKLLMSCIILAGMVSSASADPQTIITNIASVPGKLHNHIQSEIAKSKEFQKQKWAESKVQFANLKKLFIKN